MPSYDWQRAVVLSTYTLICVVVVGAMYWAQAVFIPLALAMLFTLVLTPLVSAVQRLHVGRAAAVILVVALASGTLAGMGWIVARQFVDLAEGLPAYRDTIKAKVRSLKGLATGPSTGKFGKLIEDVADELETPAGAATDDSAATPAEGTSGSLERNEAASDPTDPMPRVQRIVVQPNTPAWLGRLTAAVGSLGASLATLALASVLTIFMLIHRERLRDRLIFLIGHGRMTATTKAFDEAVHRISRFLLVQAVVNGTYGTALFLGLLLLGVPYALLWGLMAALLRYLPYVGPWIAATPPVLLSVVMFDGWGQPLLVVGWIVFIELVSNNFVEPLLYGHSMGVSAVALLVAAAFWAFLWGPIGLVLSSPLTVCLVVLGKYVPQLKFVDTLMGDEPVLQPHETLYQRLLARDPDEARQIALTQVQNAPAEQVFDTLLVPALSYLKRDLKHDRLTTRDEDFMLRAFREIVDELAERIRSAAATADRQADASDRSEPERRVRIALCPAEGAIDKVAVEMLRVSLDPQRWNVQAVSDDTLAGELLESISDQDKPLVCFVTVAPSSLAHIRYFCKRLRSYRADVKIVIGRWGAADEAAGVENQLGAVGADRVAWTLLETGKNLEAWWPVLAGSVGPPTSEEHSSATKVASQSVAQ